MESPPLGPNLRHTASPWTLLGQAAGGPQEIAGKLERLGRTLRLWLSPGELERRLKTLEAKGYARARPSRLQLLFGGLDMLRFVIEPAAREYYRQQRISFAFHQCLRILDDPVSMIDPTGLLSMRDTITGHVMQVVHLNPLFDLQLLELFPEGLERFERELEAMVAGSHPRARTIAAVVEDPGYHARLLAYVRRYRVDPTTPPLVREQGALRDDPRFAAAERQFATLPGFLAYCNGLPRGFAALLRRLCALREFAPTPEAAGHGAVTGT